MTATDDGPIRVYLVDDQALIRASFRSLLGGDPRMEVVGDCGDPRKAIEEAKRLRPDVVVLDITMPGLSGIDVLPRIRADVPRAHFLFVTNHESGRLLEDALRAGADGYLTKDAEPEELLLAIRAVHRGDPYVSSRVTHGLVAQVRGGDQVEAGEDDEPVGGRLSALTAREREVFQLLALGRANKEVARELGISLGTAKKHRENLQRKLRAGSSAELARIAIQEGLL